ncbi:MAG: serine protease [Oligoflexia bacterium]|nr:serine protease [Oligoflexia bacterium]
MKYLKPIAPAVIPAFIGLASSFAAMAQSTPFTRWESLSESQQRSLLPLREASVSFDTVGGSTCTGTFISNDGYILTAAHCIDSALYNALDEQKPGSDSLLSPILYHVKDSSDQLQSFTKDQTGVGRISL